MKQEVRDAWVAALRSGCYLQHNSAGLRSSHGGFSALGVLMDLGTDGRWEPGNDTLPSGFYRVSGGGHRAWSHLHTVVALRVGITQHDEDHIFDKSLFCTFAEIAAWIEENVAVTP